MAGTGSFPENLEIKSRGPLKMNNPLNGSRLALFLVYLIDWKEKD